MVRSCAAYNCTSRWTKYSDIGFHNFPVNNANLIKKWIAATKRKDFKPTKNSAFCSKHFTKDDYHLVLPNTKRKRLKNEAVPTVFDFPAHMQPSSTKRRRTVSRNKLPINQEQPELYEAPDLLVEAGQLPDDVDIEPLATCSSHLNMSSADNVEDQATLIKPEPMEESSTDHNEDFELNSEAELGKYEVSYCDDDDDEIEEEKVVIKSEPLDLRDSNPDSDLEVKSETELVKDKVADCDPPKVEEVFIKTENESDSDGESFLDEEEEDGDVRPLNKPEDELVMLDRLAGKPEKPPNSAYGLFSRLMLQDKDLNQIKREPRNWMKDIAFNWSELPEEEKQIYAEKVQLMHNTYRLQVDKYLEGFPEDKKAEELARLRSRNKTIKRKNTKKESCNEETSNDPLAQDWDDHNPSSEEDGIFHQKKITERATEIEGSQLKTMIVNGRKIYCCQICCYTTIIYFNIKKHTYTHIYNKPYLCRVCSNSYNYSGLKRHIPNHFVVIRCHEPLKCNVCPSSGSSTQLLKSHLTTHPGHGSNECNCSSNGCKFSYPPKNPIHSMLYKCSICTFITLDFCSLERHIATHSEQRLYNCNICQYNCCDLISIKKHISSHSKLRVYACDFCSTSFNCLSGLKNHIALNHSDVHDSVKPMTDSNRVQGSDLRAHMAGVLSKLLSKCS